MLNISTPREDPMYTLNPQLAGSRRHPGRGRREDKGQTWSPVRRAGGGGAGDRSHGRDCWSWPAVFLKGAAVRDLTIFISVLLLSDLFHNKRFSNGTGLGVVFRTPWPMAWVGLQSSLSLSVLTGHSR